MFCIPAKLPGDVAAAVAVPQPLGIDPLSRKLEAVQRKWSLKRH